MRDFDPTAGEFISSGYIDRSRPSGVLYDPMTILAGGAILGPLITGSMASDATSSAANTTAGATDRATQLQRDMFNQNKADVQPWMSAGSLSLSQLSQMLGIPGGGDPTAPNYGMLTKPFGMSDFTADPGYQFRLSQGADMIKNQASALGGVNSGATLKSLSDYAQGQASSEYQNAFNRWNTTLGNIFARLSGVSGTGANAALGIAGIGNAAAGQMGANTIAGGEAIGAGKIGSANAMASGLQQMFANFGAMNNPWIMSSVPQYSGYTDAGSVPLSPAYG